MEPHATQRVPRSDVWWTTQAAYATEIENCLTASRGAQGRTRLGSSVARSHRRRHRDQARAAGPRGAHLMPARGAARKPRSRTDHLICACPRTPVRSRPVAAIWWLRRSFGELLSVAPARRTASIRSRACHDRAAASSSPPRTSDTDVRVSGHVAPIAADAPPNRVPNQARGRDRRRSTWAYFCNTEPARFPPMAQSRAGPSDSRAFHA
jgi:hypothetical protein